MPIPPIIPLAFVVCTTTVVITAMALISRHISQRRISPRTMSDDEIARRLERIEQIVESTAIEVERVAESNRFVAKLLADKTG